MKYAIVSGCYSDWDLHGYINDKEEAEKYCALQNKGDDNWGDYYVVELNQLNFEYSQDVKFKKLYQSMIYMKSGELREDGYEMYTGNTKPTEFSCNTKMWFCIKGTFDNQEQCNKALNDYYAKYLTYCYESDSKTAIDLLSQELKKGNIIL